MIFRFIYVDDDGDDRRRVKRAVAAHNRKTSLVRLEMIAVNGVERLEKKLAVDVDLVLADVNFVIGTKEVSRLKDIINTVSTWSRKLKHSPPPVISYTGFEKGTLTVSLKEREQLLDIWDKDSCSQEYVTWRLSKIAIDISRLRPDSFLVRLIQKMPPGASWHDLVKQMPVSYNIGRTETDQIEGIGQDIQTIGQRLDVWGPVKEMWRVMTEWERLSRAVSATVRGHARHVVNVFWMGYYMIHHPILSDWFSRTWAAVLARRAEQLKTLVASDGKNEQLRARADALTKLLNSDVKPLESLSNAWFFAALFHDIGNCVPKYREVRKVGDGLVETFGCRLVPLAPTWMPADIDAEAGQLFAEMDPAIAKALVPLWEGSLRNETPDHGVVGALYIRKKITQESEVANACEAARAMCLHNLIGEPSLGEARLLDWDREPLGCLLILCDQIQTWDRERGDEGIYGPDLPSRAQLTALNITESQRIRSVEMDVQYIVPSHIEHSDVLYRRMKEKLAQVLREKPMSALFRVGLPWPFRLLVKCSLGGEEFLEPIRMG